MKNLIIITCLIFSTTLLSQEWGGINKNTVTMKEIAPIWPGCENSSATKRDACFDEKLMAHVIKNFKYPAEAYNKNVQGKVTVTFIVNTKGVVEIKEVSGGDKSLQEEAKRNILSIPKMKPGMLAGKPKAIEYTVPMNFKTGK